MKIHIVNHFTEISCFSGNSCFYLNVRKSIVQLALFVLAILSALTLDDVTTSFYSINILRIQLKFLKNATTDLNCF